VNLIFYNPLENRTLGAVRALRSRPFKRFLRNGNLDRHPSAKEAGLEIARHAALYAEQTQPGSYLKNMSPNVRGVIGGSGLLPMTDRHIEMMEPRLRSRPSDPF